MDKKNGTLGKYSSIMRDAAAAWMKRMNEMTEDFDPADLQPKPKEEKGVPDLSGGGL